MIKTLLILFLSFGTIQLGICQDATMQWAKRQGGTAYDVGNGIAVDVQGNVYTVGYYENSGAYFDENNMAVTSVGGTDVFVTKYNSAGQLVWLKTFGGTGFDEGSAIALDAQGNVYVTGFFYSICDFNPAPGTTNVFNLTAAGQSDNFVVKLTNNGDFIWARKFGNTANDESYDIAVDKLNNVIVGGIFAGTVDFNPGTPVNNLAASGGLDGFVLKLNSDGNYAFAIKVGSSADDYVNAVKVDANNNVVCGGLFRNTVDFDPSAAVASQVSLGGFDAYIAKYSATGAYQWAKKFGGAGDDELRSISISSSNTIFFTGSYVGNVIFPTLPASSLVSSANTQDICIGKMDVSGNMNWIKSIGNNGYDQGISIYSDQNDNCYTTGSFKFTVDFNPSPIEVNSLTSVGISDVFVVKLNSLGNYEWAKNFGRIASTINFGRGVVADELGGVYTIGSFYNTGNYNPNNGTLLLTSQGGSEIFFHKLLQCNQLNPQDICKSSVSVKSFISSYLEQNTAIPLMRPVLSMQGIAGANPDDCDQITIELRSSQAPHNLVASASCVLKTNGQATANFNETFNGDYYIVIKNRLALETWSATPVYVGFYPVFYDFTNSISSAYGDNLQAIPNTTNFALFSGDIDQDQSVSSSDYSLWETKANNFESGFLSEDINGNGAVESEDFSIWENNANSFVSSSYPQ